MSEEELFKILLNDGWDLDPDPCPHCGMRALICDISLVTVHYCVWCSSIGGEVNDLPPQPESEANP